MRLIRRLVSLVLVGLLLVVAILIMVEGSNVAATQPHFQLVRWFLASIRNHSIATHSADIVPPALDDPQLVKTGLQEYNEMCVTCHGAPGQTRSAIGQGLNPEPPNLATAEVQAYSDAELYWIIKHGIRMTGMPAFGPTHDDHKLWSLVAFIRTLPHTTAQQYAAMVEAFGEHEEQGKHDHSHTHTTGGNTDESMH